MFAVPVECRRADTKRLMRFLTKKTVLLSVAGFLFCCSNDDIETVIDDSDASMSVDAANDFDQGNTQADQDNTNDSSEMSPPLMEGDDYRQCKTDEECQEETGYGFVNHLNGECIKNRNGTYYCSECISNVDCPEEYVCFQQRKCVGP